MEKEVLDINRISFDFLRKKVARKTDKELIKLYDKYLTYIYSIKNNFILLTNPEDINFSDEEYNKMVELAGDYWFFLEMKIESDEYIFSYSECEKIYAVVKNIKYGDNVYSWVKSFLNNFKVFLKKCIEEKKDLQINIIYL